MAVIGPAFEKMMMNEGGYIVHTVKGDIGGMTYAGISRKYHPSWSGWSIIDDYLSNKNYCQIETSELTDLVKDFYNKNYWYPLKCFYIDNQKIANSLFDFAVNTGIRTASKLIQIVVQVTPDGFVGPKTINAINTIDYQTFSSRFFISKVARYTNICNNNKSQSKFLLGWINRCIKYI